MRSSLLPILLLPFVTQVKLVDVTDQNLPSNDLFRNSMDVVSADLDKDGDPDLVVACEFCPNFILVNDGKGKFTNESTSRLPKVAHDSEDIAAEDFDGDGDIDLVFVSEDDFVHEYYINEGKGFFSDASQRFAFNSKANAVCALDADADGDKDLVIGNEGQDLLLVNDGKGGWFNATSMQMPVDNDITQDVKSFDADRDGDLDLVFGNEDSGKLYLNDGKGKFSIAINALPQIVHSVETRKVVLADIDRDGDQDLFYCNVAFRQGRDLRNLLLLNDGKGKFRDATTENFLGDNNMMSLDAQFMDLNGDQWIDLVVSNGFGGRLQYFLNNGGKFTETQDKSFPAFPGADIISLLNFKNGNSEFLYLGLFRGKDKLLMVQQ